MTKRRLSVVDYLKKMLAHSMYGLKKEMLISY